MLEVVQYLMDNLDIADKVEEGSASLVGVSSEEAKVIIDVFFNHNSKSTAYFWE